MSKERTLANIAETAFWGDVESENKNTFDRVAKAVEKEVLERFKNDEEEPIIAGQELNHYQVLRWIEKYGRASGLQYTYQTEWADCEGILNHVIDTKIRYRVAPKKTNDPDDPTTWEKGVAIFVRDSGQYSWILDVFSHYKIDVNFKYITEFSGWRYAKLATPEQIEAWKLINDDVERAT